MRNSTSTGTPATRRRLRTGGVAALAALALLGAACSDDADDADDLPGTGGATSTTATTPAPTTGPAGTAPGVEPTTTVPGASTSTGPDGTGPSSTTTGPDTPSTPTTPPTTTLGDGSQAPRPTLAPVELDDEGDFRTGVTVELAGITAVQGEARGPGEIAGPALRVEVRVRNDTDAAVPFTTAQVEVTYGADQTPGVQLSGPDVVRFPESIPAGGEATAAYVFRVPESERGRVQVSVGYRVDVPVVVFEGAAP